MVIDFFQNSIQLFKTKRIYFLWSFWIGMVSYLHAQPVVEASIDPDSSFAQIPLEGILSITHEQKETIDPHFFEWEGKPLEVSFVRDVPLSGASTITFYQFQLPGQEKGLYVLSPVSVKVEGKIYRSIPSSYEVKGEMAASTSSRPSTPNPKRKPPSRKVSKTSSAAPLVFRLEAEVKGPKVLYPGQRTKLFYRISYNRSVDLSRSELPFIHPQHFKKIGDVQIRDYQERDLTLQDITQEIEASDLGTFDLGPSLIEGYAYSLNGGQKVYDPTLLYSEVPVVHLEVKQFPQQDQPVTFTGAIGSIKVEAELTHPASVSVGDMVSLAIRIGGISNLSDLRLSPLECQPGITGFFQIPDLPPLAEIEDKIKLFHVELRPLTTWIKEIPSIEVSSFDPSTKKYVSKHTSPIPLRVYSHAPPLINNSDPLFVMTPQPIPLKWPTPPLLPLEFTEDPISKISIRNVYSMVSWVALYVPIWIALLIFNFYAYRWWKNKPKAPIKMSDTIFQQAMKIGSDPLRQAHLFEHAFWWRAWEKGIIENGKFNLEEIPQEGNCGAIRSFLYQLQMIQYGAQKNLDPIKMKQMATSLFKSFK